MSNDLTIDEQTQYEAQQAEIINEIIAERYGEANDRVFRREDLGQDEAWVNASRDLFVLAHNGQSPENSDFEWAQEGVSEEDFNQGLAEWAFRNLDDLNNSEEFHQNLMSAHNEGYVESLSFDYLASRSEDISIPLLESFGNSIGSAASDAWNWTSSTASYVWNNPGEAATRTGAAIVGFQNYVQTRPLEALDLFAQGGLNAVTSTAALVPATFKVIVNIPSNVIHLGQRHLPPDQRFPKWRTDFNEAMRIDTGAVERVRTRNAERDLDGDGRPDGNRDLNGYQKTVLYGTQAVGEAGVFVAGSVLTGGAFGAGMAATRGSGLAARTAQIAARTGRGMEATNRIRTAEHFIKSGETGVLSWVGRRNAIRGMEEALSNPYSRRAVSEIAENADAARGLSRSERLGELTENASSLQSISRSEAVLARYERMLQHQGNGAMILNHAKYGAQAGFRLMTPGTGPIGTTLELAGGGFVIWSGLQTYNDLTNAENLLAVELMGGAENVSDAELRAAFSNISFPETGDNIDAAIIETGASVNNDSPASSMDEFNLQSSPNYQAPQPSPLQAMFMEADSRSEPAQQTPAQAQPSADATAQDAAKPTAQFEYAAGMTGTKDIPPAMQAKIEIANGVESAPNAPSNGSALPRAQSLTIQRGDTLSGIVMETYGIRNISEALDVCGQIAQINNIDDINLIREGETLTLPERQDIERYINAAQNRSASSNTADIPALTS